MEPDATRLPVPVPRLKSVAWPAEAAAMIAPLWRGPVTRDIRNIRIRR